MRKTTRPARGATQNEVSARFALPSRQADGDWLDDEVLIDSAPRRQKTTVTVETARSILSHNQSPDVPFDRSVNPYRGCEHGCIYCFARPSHAYHDLSPGLDFETRLFAKHNAANLLHATIAKRGYAAAPIAFGTNTDPYQPIERDWGIMRQCLTLLAACNHPIYITTKSDRIVRDIDLLGPMASKNLVKIAISVTSLDPRTAMTLEPRAPAPERRLQAVRALVAAGVPTWVSIAPVIPAITDHEMEQLIARAAQAGAAGASYIPLRLPWEVAPLFKAWLAEHFPDRAGKVMSIIKQLRGGRENDPAFGSRMRGQGVWADLLRTRFRIACRKYGLNAQHQPLRCDLFCPPAGPQGELF